MEHTPKLFFLYAPADKAHRDAIVAQLSKVIKENEIKTWDISDEKAGSEWRKNIDHHLNEADFVVLLVSAEFLSDNYRQDLSCYDIMTQAHTIGKALLPVIVSHCAWDEEPIIAEAHPIPIIDNKTVPISSKHWETKAEVYDHIRRAIMDRVRSENADKKINDNATNQPNTDTDKGKIQNPNDHLTPTSNLSSVSSPSHKSTNMPNNLTFDNGYALAIGVGNYENYNSLPITVSDAKAIQSLLTDPNRAAYLPQNVSLVVPSTTQLVTAERIKNALENFVQLVNNSYESNKTVVLYYSGHGYVYNGNHYICPADYLVANGMVANGISAAEFVAYINRIVADRIVVLLDCCYAGGIKSTESIGDKLSQGKGKVIIASSSNKQTSKILPGASYSLFTDILIKALCGEATPNNSENVVRMFQVLGYVDRELRNAGMDQDLQIKTDGLEGFPICAYNPSYAKDNSADDWLSNFWEKEGRPKVNPVNGGSITVPPVKPQTDFAAIEKAYKNADWVEVIDLLDDHFGDDPTPQYSILKRSIEAALNQSLQPTLANQQALKMLINKLKR